MQDLGREKCAGPAFGHLYYSQVYSKWKPGLKRVGSGLWIRPEGNEYCREERIFWGKNLKV